MVGHEPRRKTPLLSGTTFVIDHILPNEQGPALFVSCGECGPAGKGRAHSQTTASGPGALRGSSMLIDDDAGEGDLPTAQRDLSPSITPSTEAVGDEESSRAVD